MILAAPLVIPFAKAVGLSVGTLGMAALADKVNDYIEANPEESAMILKTLVPNLGIGEIFMKKGKDEEVEEEVSIEDMDPRDLTREEKAKEMKRRFKEGTGSKREIGRKGYEEVIQPGEDRTLEEADERYEGGIDDAPKPKFDYTKFFRRRRADGGAIGVESLFEERTPFRFGGAMGSRYGGGSRSGPSRGPAGGASAGGNYGGNRNPQQTYGGSIFRGGGGGPRPGTGSAGPAGGATRKITPTTSNFGLRTLEFAKKYNPLNLVFGTPVEAEEFKLDDLIGIGAAKPGKFYGYNLTDKGKALEDFRETATKFKFSKNPAKTPQAALNFITDPARTGLYGKSDIVKEKDFIQSAIDKGFLGTEKDYGLQKPLDEYLADGGRVGFNVGGITDPAALAIYNSMNAYGFSDQEIADTITAQGYDAGTLGQGPSIPTPVPVAPEPGEGIIGIDLQERGGGFNPFGPLDSTFTRDLTDMDMYKGVNVEGLTPVQQMNKYRTATQDNMFGLGRFFQPKIRGTLGTRLANQPRLPLPASIAAYSMSPFNPDSKNYNPDFVDQLNYLELGDDLIGMSSVGLKYGKGSVLAGKNVISGFGSNNYLTALNKFIRNTKNEERRKQGERERDAFLAAEEARKEREAKEQLEIQRAATREADRRAGAFDDRVRLDPGGGGTFKEQTAAKERQGVQVAGPGFGKGAYFAEGGLASMFAEKR